jgi:hypothetical protein
MVTDDFTNRLILYTGAVAMRLRVVRLRLLGAHIGRNGWIRRIEVPRKPWDIVIGDGVSCRVPVLGRNDKRLQSKNIKRGFDQ